MIYFELPIIENLPIKIITTFIVTIIMLIILYVIKRSRKSKMYDYFREIPDNLPPAILKYYDKGKISNKTFWLTLLDLIRRDYFSLERIKTNNSIEFKIRNLNNHDEKELFEYERLIYITVNSIIKSQPSKELLLSNLNNMIKQNINYKENYQKIYSNLELTIQQKYGYIDKSLNYILCILFNLFNYFVFFPKDTILGIVIGLFFSSLVMCISKIIKNSTFSFKSLISLVTVIFILAIIIIPFIPTLIIAENSFIYTLVLINPLIYIINIMILDINFYDKRQMELVNKIEGLKKFLTDFTILKERPIDYINFVKQFYVLAETFNIKITDVNHPSYEYDNEMFETLTANEFTEAIAFVYGDILKMLIKK